MTSPPTSPRGDATAQRDLPPPRAKQPACIRTSLNIASIVEASTEPPSRFFFSHVTPSIQENDQQKYDAQPRNVRQFPAGIKTPRSRFALCGYTGHRQKSLLCANENLRMNAPKTSVVFISRSPQPPISIGRLGRSLLLHWYPFAISITDMTTVFSCSPMRSN